MLILSSCDYFEKNKISEQKFKKGYKGLMMDTLKNQPPDRIYPNSDFNLALKIENQGAYKLTNGRITLSNYIRNYLFFEETSQTITRSSQQTYLQGKSITNPGGDYTYLVFKGKAKKLPLGVEEHKRELFIIADYSYQNVLSQTVCINPNPYEVHKANCQVESKTSLSGQGSPLAITQIEEIIIPGTIPRVRFILTLKNKGDGEVKGLITLTQAKLGGKKISCDFKNNPSKNKNKFKFPSHKNQETAMICEKIIDSSLTYSTTLLIDLAFNYRLEKTKEIIIKE